MNTMITKQSKQFPLFSLLNPGVGSVETVHALELALQRMSDDQLLKSREILLRLSRDLKLALKEEREIIETLARNMFNEKDGAALSYILAIMGQLPGMDPWD